MLNFINFQNLNKTELAASGEPRNFAIYDLRRPVLTPIIFVREIRSCGDT